MNDPRWLPIAIPLLIAGCFTPPDSPGRAERALRAAEADGAKEYLPEEHALVVRLLGDARRELVRQDQLDIVERNYRRANRLLAHAEEQAELLQSWVPIRKQQVRAAVEAEAQMLMVSTTQLEDRFPEVSEPDLWFGIRALQDALEAARFAFAEGRYLEALQIIRNAQRSADEIETELELEENV